MLLILLNTLPIYIVKKQYNNIKTNIKKHKPHIFTIAKQSYNQLIKNHKNQSILISGESGSGKTVTTKFIMKYLTCEDEEFNLIEDKILSSNIILEAFGNAKTLRNDNSSRFGKFIKLFYSSNNKIIGGTIETYLLEQVRIVNHHKQERNYHIFYMLLKSLPSEIKQNLFLKDFTNYDILNNQYVSRDMNDIEEFTQFEQKMKLFFTNIEIIEIYKLLSVVLLLGNCKVKNKNQSIEFVNTQEVNEICDLLQITKQNFINLLFSRTMTTSSNEVYKINLTATQINLTIQCITKSIYSNLFDFIVEKINKNINCDSLQNEEHLSFIGILDIFGFEVFKQNNYEQLLINFTNEILQKQFNYFVFKKEQEIYKKEQIHWENIQFPDNNDVVKLFLNKSQGLFHILNDCCQMNVDYRNFYQQIINNYENNKKNTENEESIIQFTRKLKPNHKFIIKHYASKVIYNTKNICEKNKHPLHQDILNLFDLIKLPLWKYLWKQYTMKNIRKIKKQNKIIEGTVFQKFNRQLTNLMNLIKETQTHYIRCIKPNDQNIPNNLNKIRILEQLKYSGVLQAVKIARLGYPIRFEHNMFYEFFNPYIFYKLKIQHYLDNNEYDIQKGNTKFF